MKTIIERGASWTLDETKLLLALWGLDLVQRKATNTKRTKEVYEKIAERFRSSGFERTADQVRTRVFNMIAEYRRIIKDPSPERIKKCIFFEPLHRIYEANHLEDVKSALDDYEPEFPYSPASNTGSEKGDESISDSEATDGNETINNTSTNASAQAATATISNSSSSTHKNNSNTYSSAANNSTNNNTSSSSNTNNNADLNNGDSNNEIDKESSPAATSTNNTSTHNKRIKLESPKSGQNSTNSASTSTNNSSEHLNAKQTKSSSSSSSTPASSSSATQSVPIISTTIGGPSSAAGSSSTSGTSGQRHQSLLMPHATTSTTSTPISKLSTSGANNNNTPSYININSTKLPIIRTNQLIGHSNGNESINLNGTTTRLPTTAAITSHQLYQAPVNTFDVTSSALLIDRMFAHLSRESENMREWIALEKERLALERTRRQQETEREVRRERVLIDTLMKFQEQWLGFLSRIDPRIVEDAPELPPELKIPSKENQQQTNEVSQGSSNTQSSGQAASNQSACPNSE